VQTLRSILLVPKVPLPEKVPDIIDSIDAKMIPDIIR